MAIKDRATLSTELAANITSVTAPNGITPTVDGAERQDIIDSCWNKIDDPAPSNAASVVVSGLVVPSCAVATVDNGDTLADFLQFILNLLCQLDSTMAVQGVPGQFLANIPTSSAQAFRVDSTLGVEVANLIIPNDVTEGGFDNGNNFDTASYLVPVAGFNGRFVLSKVEVELLEIKDPGGNATLEFQMQVNGADVGSAVSVTFNLGTANPGDKKYATTICYPAFGVAAAAFSPADIVTVKVKQQSSSTGDAIVQVNAATFSNQPV